MTEIGDQMTGERRFWSFVDMVVGAALSGFIIGQSIALFFYGFTMPGISADGVVVKSIAVIYFALMVGAMLFWVGFGRMILGERVIE